MTGPVLGAALAAPMSGLTSYERALLRAAGNPARCGRFLAYEWEHTPPGHELRHYNAQLGCSDVVLPPAYSVESTERGLRVYRGARVIAEVVNPVAPPVLRPLPASTLTVIDRRPGHERDAPVVYPFHVTERREGGALMIDVPQQ